MLSRPTTFFQFVFYQLAHACSRFSPSSKLGILHKYPEQFFQLVIWDLGLDFSSRSLGQCESNVSLQRLRGLKVFDWPDSFEILVKKFSRHLQILALLKTIQTIGPLCTGSLIFSKIFASHLTSNHFLGIARFSILLSISSLDYWGLSWKVKSAPSTVRYVVILFRLCLDYYG